MQLRGFSSWSASTYKAITVSNATIRSSTYATVASRGNGEVAVAWYGSTTAGDPSSTFSGSWDVYVARVTGFWTATPSVTLEKVTSVSNHVGGFCMNGITCLPGTDRDLLDYFGIAYDAAGNLHVAYGHDGATSSPSVRYAKLPALP
jgi:hypothetical protein